MAMMSVVGAGLVAVPRRFFEWPRLALEADFAGTGGGPL